MFFLGSKNCSEAAKLSDTDNAFRFAFTTVDLSVPMQQYESIRAQAIDFFLENGADPMVEFQEVILLSNGHYNGRRFYCNQLQAIWMPENGELVFFNGDTEQARICISENLPTANAA